MAQEQTVGGALIPLRFTEEDYQIMIAELSCEPAKIDMALTIILKILEGVDSAFHTWTRYYFIREHGLAEDLKQYVCFELLKKVPLKIRDENGAFVDPQRFQAWVLTAGKYRAYDFTRREIRYRYPSVEEAMMEEEDFSDASAKKTSSYVYIPMKALDEAVGDEEREQYRGMYADPSQMNDVPTADVFAAVEFEDDLDDRLARCLDTILRSKTATHKTVTWIAYQVLVNLHGTSRKETTRWMAKKLENRTLDDIFAMAYRYADRFRWLKLAPYQMELVRDMLNAPTADGRRAGELLYGECFMKKGGRASISDWLNRFQAIMEREGRE